VVPSVDIVENIWVSPFAGLQVEDPDTIELLLRIPSTIDIDLVFGCKD
jgi:hypothetical protein